MTQTAPSIATPLLVPASTRLGPIHLSVRNRADALAIWSEIVGLSVISEDQDTVVLGVGDTPLVVLYPGAAMPVTPNTLGLYHVAIHVPTRRDLARALNRAAQARIRISPTDHLVSEALYLWDLDGNGIEITYETPWRGSFVENDELMAITADGKLHSGREPIDVAGLLAELDGDDAPLGAMPVGTRIGHVHVHVDDLDKAMTFYRDQIGFAGQLLSRRYGMGDVNLDYAPHIIAFNIWAGPNAPRPSSQAAGLRWFEIILPDASTLDAIRTRLIAAGSVVSEIDQGVETRDPAGNRVRLLLA